MHSSKLIEPVGYFIAGITFIFSFFLFYYQTSVPMGSLLAAAIAAGLNWMTWVIMRLLIISLRK